MNPGENWKQDSRGLQAEFDCGSFVEAVRMINKIAKLAEDHNHHPDLCLVDYQRLTIKLISHDAKKVTDRDYKLAAAIDGLFA